MLGLTLCYHLLPLFLFTLQKWQQSPPPPTIREGLVIDQPGGSATPFRNRKRIHSNHGFHAHLPRSPPLIQFFCKVEQSSPGVSSPPSRAIFSSRYRAGKRSARHDCLFREVMRTHLPARRPPACSPPADTQELYSVSHAQIKHIGFTIQESERVRSAIECAGSCNRIDLPVLARALRLLLVAVAGGLVAFEVSSKQVRRYVRRVLPQCRAPETAPTVQQVRFISSRKA